MRRTLFRTAAVVGLLLLVSGAVLAVRAYRQVTGPADAVRGYFAALARGDAAGALARGDVPGGPHSLLTAAVLRSQQRIAPLRHVTVTATRQSGSRAQVSVRYVLEYAGAPQTITATVGLHRPGSDWRLDQAALPASLEMDRAAQRATVVGAPVPDGDTLLFPGAVPITFDTPYLRLTAGADSVTFGHAPDVRVYVEISPAGRAAVLRAVQQRLSGCLGGGGDAGCPLPDERYVPDSIRGRLAGALTDSATVTLAPDDAGVVQVDGSPAIDASTYRRLTFQNRMVTGSGTVRLEVHAHAYAVTPLRLVWTRS